MTPHSNADYSVDVLLLSTLTHGDVLEVSRDIWDEALDYARDEQRYLAISTASLPSWELYPIKPSSGTSLKHSTIWLPSSIYSRFCDHSVFARPAVPIILTSLLVAFPSTTYHIVSQDHLDLQALAQEGYIFRTGSSIHINGYRGKVEMCEPVRQGIINSRTEIVIARDQNEVVVYADSEADDEGVLGISTLLESSYMSLPEQQYLHYSVTLLAAGITSFKTWRAEPITFPIKLAQKVTGDPDYRLYGSLELLLELGLFSGDVVQVATESASQAAPRTLTICSFPPEAETETVRDDTLYMPPILYHNMAGHVKNCQLNIYGLKAKQRPPIAKSVTLGRVPSPASIDRALQAAFLTALKFHFENARRTVRAGDLVLLGIDETLARVTAQDDADNDVLSEYTQLSGRRNDTFAWFKVLEVQLEHEGSDYKGDAIVDADNTRMVQAGVEKARIPPLAQWAGFYSLPRPALPAMDIGTPFQKLTELIGSTFAKSARKAHTCSTVLLHGARGSGKRTVVSSTAAALGMHFLEVNCYDIVGETDVKTEAYLRIKFENASQCAPSLLLLRNIDALAKKKEDMESGQESKMRFILADSLLNVAVDAGEQFPVAVVATTSDYDKVPDGVLGCFRHIIEIGAPSEAERLVILQNLVRGLPLAPDVSVHSIAVRSAALVAADLVNVVKKAQNFAQDRLDDLAEGLEHDGATNLSIAGGWVTASDFDQAINEARRNYSDSIGAPKIPNVTWDDVGGLASVKDDIMDTIQLPLERPELFASGMKKRSGILFYGPPGTGKTLLAKAVATSFSLNFFSVKGPELLNMYIGESEANVRRVFQRARDARPCVVFFDELDSVAPKRGNQGDSGGVMDRIVSQLLSELDGMSEGKDGSGGVFVIGATNRPDLLDPALLRPGRFDKMLYLGVSDTDDAQLNILQALTRKFRLAPDLDLRDVAQACPFTYTGADFYALCSDAMLKAMTRQASAVDAKVKALDPPRSTQYFFDHFATKDDTDVMVSKIDFMQAMKELIPSVSQSELNHYKKVQAQFSPSSKEEKPNGVNGHAQFTEVEDDEGMYT